MTEKSMKIPLSDLSAQYIALKAEIDAAVAEVLSSGRYVKGPVQEKFERAFAETLDVRHAIAVGNGTDAIAFTLEAAGIRSGDEVILPANTFSATAEAVFVVGATPRLCDVDPDTLLVSTATLGDALAKKTRAVIPVHLFGYVAPMEEILEFAKVHHLAVVEDAAQAHGAHLHNRAAGTFGDLGAFSFFPSKILGAAGDAGAVVTNREEYDGCIRTLRSHGQGPVDTLAGRNSRMDELQAAVLLVKLRHLDAWIHRRREIESILQRELKGTGDISFLLSGAGVQPAPLNVVVRTSRRDDLNRHLSQLGVESKAHYARPIHLQPAFGSLDYSAGQFPHAEVACRQILSLPNYPEMSEDQIAYLIDAVRSFYR